ncbi:MAG: molybdenum cofactor guanylyltransferase MobA [Pseudomonadota bacterium]|jgi:molybdopterin-guanine dinucleotide biosynthesis protein A
MKDELGIDKAHLPFGAINSLWEWQFIRLNKLFRNVYFSSKNLQYENVIPDKESALGVDIREVYAPMVGFFSALYCFDEAFFIAVDTPFFGKEQIEKMLKTANENRDVDAIVALSNGKMHPTIAIYRNSILQTLEEHISQNKLKLMLFLSTTKYITVGFDDKYMQNINDKEGYERACLLI